MSFFVVTAALVGCAGAGGGGGGSKGSGGVPGSGGIQAGGGGVTGSGGVTGGGGTSGAPAGTGGAAESGGTPGSGGGPAAGGQGGGAGAAGRGGAAPGGGGTAGGSAGGGPACPGAAYDPAIPPRPLALTGNLGAHDPAALVVGNDIYLYATGLIAKTSHNLTAWSAAANPLAALPSWIAAAVPGATDLWAPDVSSFGGLYHLYYAASTFGSNTSCIGQATRTSLASGSWADQGRVICSNVGHGGDDWNAIDPNVVVDGDGTPWLAFGSFWGGIKMVKLDSTGGRADDTLHDLAARPGNAGAVEGAWIFPRCGQYYLFTSWGSCCSSPYDYNIRVGRASAVTGPYVDQAGTPLVNGGGTLLVQGNGDWVAPGHNAVIVYGGRTYIVYHALQGGSSGPATLRIAELTWDGAGWPVSGGP